MNTTALAIIQPDELDTIQRTGRMLAASGYFDAKGDSAQSIAMMATKILAGREMGFGPFASVNGVHIINGKPSIGANLMASAVKSSGRYTYKVRELTTKICRIEFYEREGNTWVTSGMSEYTMGEATAAGLAGKDVWKKHPKNMLFARSLSNGARWFCADIFSGNAVYVPEELGADVDDEGNVIEATGRRVDSATGEILEPVKPVDVDFSKPTNGNGHTASASVDNPFEGEPLYYAAAWNQLTGQPYDLVKWVAALHKNSGGECSKKQYGYLTALVDALTSNEHNYALSVLCQSEISKANMVGVKVADALLKILQPTLKIKDEAGVEQVIDNPDYRPDMAQMITTIAQAQAEPEPHF